MVDYKIPTTLYECDTLACENCPACTDFMRSLFALTADDTVKAIRSCTVRHDLRRAWLQGRGPGRSWRAVDDVR